MVELRLSVAARADLASIDEYGARQFGDDVADAYSRSFAKAFDLLCGHPELGEARPRLGIGMRCLIHRRHRIFYRVEEESLLVVRILHHAQDSRRHLRR
ncbi:MAG TPA: type II toxin-antitoxin system RelE/ParE family toxin [Sphingomonadaceae bacterium]|nr:type II toxin-antitoxin system RelE/ParE family toxin [Sphingomonadaceae bacterium]